MVKMWSCSENTHTTVNLPLPKLDALRKMGFTAASQRMPLYWNASFTACCQIFKRLLPRVVQLVQMQPSQLVASPTLLTVLGDHPPGLLFIPLTMTSTIPGPR